MLKEKRFFFNDTSEYSVIVQREFVQAEWALDSRDSVVVGFVITADHIQTPPRYKKQSPQGNCQQQVNQRLTIYHNTLYQGGFTSLKIKTKKS